MIFITETRCSTKDKAPASVTPRHISQEHTKEYNDIQKETNPRVLASLMLTHQGQRLLQNGQIDESISTFERAININPRNGKSYYFLAEAWLAKGNIHQAIECNHLAEMYLKEDEHWNTQVFEQRTRIEQEN